MWARFLGANPWRASSAYRLIIDRSILLLLSASKCCLRLGEERLKGLEARKLIGVQIRVSISIIMALVKCSVFDSEQRPAAGMAPSELPASGFFGHNGELGAVIGGTSNARAALRTAASSSSSSGALKRPGASGGGGGG